VPASSRLDLNLGGGEDSLHHLGDGFRPDSWLDVR
jgi:hypothetical protein